MVDKVPLVSIPSVRRLLMAAFTAQTLRRFCQDRPAFRPILDRFGPGLGFDEMVDRVIDYCNVQNLFDDLLAEIREFNPRQYALVEPDLYLSAEALAALPSPYRGLEPFEAAHAEFYFGREAMVEQLVNKVREHDFVAIVGSSGCGKSSLVRAGLVTALRRGDLPGSEDWAVHIFRPGPDPLRALARQLVQRLDPEASEADLLTQVHKIADGLLQGTILMDDVVARLEEKQPTVTRLVLIVDQFEELYTECQEEGWRRSFIDTMLAAAGAKILVILTLRADFYGRVLADQQLSRAVDAGLVNVLPMSEEELRAVIEQPALKLGRKFERGLVERILTDVGDEPGNLPLLEFALQELWTRQTVKGLLVHDAYEAIGRVEGAITRRAEAVYKDLADRDQEKTVRRIFLRLVHYDQGTLGTRRRATLEEMVTPHTPRTVVDLVIKALADARLLVTGHEETPATATVEVSHEALIQGWGRLRRWLDEDRAFGLWRERLAVTRQTWEDTERDEGALLHGAPLAEAEGQLSDRGDDLNIDERQFIKESLSLRQREEDEKRAQRQRELDAAHRVAEEQYKAARRLRVLVVVLALIALVAPGLWVRQQILKARARGQLATIGTSQALPAFSIERYEVTNRQYRLCVTAGACTPPQERGLYEGSDRNEHPVVAVTAYQADNYCRWLGRRLPTELEWEQAARGSNGRPWPWGEEAPEPARLNLMFEQTAGGTVPVGSYPLGATPEDVFDLAGNVWEWTATPAGANPSEPDPGWQDPLVDWLQGPLIIRGGSWKCTPTCLAQITVRVETLPSLAKDDIGFRCVKDLP